MKLKQILAVGPFIFITHKFVVPDFEMYIIYVCLFHFVQIVLNSQLMHFFDSPLCSCIILE